MATCYDEAGMVAAIVLGILLALVLFKSCWSVCDGRQRPGPRSGPPLKGDKRFPFFMSESSGMWLYQRTWMPPHGVEPKAVIVFTHGFGEYSDRHAAAADVFSRNGYVFWAWDLEGHGRSDGDRGFLTDKTFDGFFSDAEQAVRTAAEAHPDLPVYVLAHSMGGLIAAHVGIRLATKAGAGSADTAGWISRLRGFVLTSPAVAVDPAVATPVAVCAARTFGGCFPRLIMARVSAADLTNSALVNEQAASDSGMQDAICGRLAVAGMDATAEIETIASGFTWPLLVLQDRDDKTTVPEAGERFVASVSSADKRAVMLGGHKHELLLADGYEDVIEGRIVPWMDERLGAGEADEGEGSGEAEAAEAGSGADVVVGVGSGSGAEEAARAPADAADDAAALV